MRWTPGTGPRYCKGQIEKTPQSHWGKPATLNWIKSRSKCDPLYKVRYWVGPSANEGRWASVEYPSLREAKAAARSAAAEHGWGADVSGWAWIYPPYRNSGREWMLVEDFGQYEATREF